MNVARPKFPLTVTHLNQNNLLKNHYVLPKLPESHDEIHLNQSDDKVLRLH